MATFFLSANICLFRNFIKNIFFRIKIFIPRRTKAIKRWLFFFFPPFFLSIEFNWKIYLPTIQSLLVLFNAANVCASLDIVPRSLRSTRYDFQFDNKRSRTLMYFPFSPFFLPLLFFCKHRSWFRFFSRASSLTPSLDIKPNRCLTANLHFCTLNVPRSESSWTMKTGDVYTRVQIFTWIQSIEFISLVFEMSASEIISCLNS